MSNLSAALAGAIAGFVAGFIAAQFISFRRVHRDDGHDKLYPRIEPHPFGRREFLFKVTLITLFLIATWYVVDFSADQRRCNREFQRTIAERALVTTDNDRARKENDQALADLVEGFLEIPPGSAGARDQSRALLEKFRETTNANNQRQEENDRKRANNPYPRC